MSKQMHRGDAPRNGHSDSLRPLPGAQPLPGLGREAPRGAEGAIRGNGRTAAGVWEAQQMIRWLVAIGRQVDLSELPEADTLAGMLMTPLAPPVTEQEPECPECDGTGYVVQLQYQSLGGQEGYGEVEFPCACQLP